MTVDRIVVGIDGSEGAIRGLRWALEEARLHGALLELVHTYPKLEHTYPQPAAVDLPERGSLATEEELAHAKIEEVIDGALARAGGPGEVEIRRTVRPGSPAEVLCEVAEDAGLLVVGARGLGGFRGLLLGSVSQQVIAHSPCPVAIITPRDGV